MLNRIEQFVFFPFVRIVGCVSALILFLILIGGLVFFTQINARGLKNSYVSFDDVKAVVNPEESNNSTNKSTLRYSAVINKYFSEDTNKEILESWLDDYESDREKQNYLDNLSEIIAKAEKKDREKVYDYLNAYAKLKERKKDGDEFSKAITKYAPPVLKGATIFGMFIVLMAFSVIIILLLLLSIERNIRKAADNSMAS